MSEKRKLNPAAVSPLGLFHRELCRQRLTLIEAEHLDDRNRLDQSFQSRHRFRLRKKQRVTSVAVRLARLYCSGSKQIEMLNLFREAVQSVRGDGTASVILPVIESALEAHKVFACGVAACGVASLLAEDHRRATQRLQEYLPVEAPEDIEDGPFGNCQWRHNGKVLTNTMQVGAWKMLKHLWTQADHVASFVDLIVPVYDDPEHIADESAFGAMRREANKFFNDHGIPWKVSLKKGSVSLQRKE